jgi:4-amino-4-deoxy-L-arabinose transferase-like glycosyltransferase
VSAPSAPGTRPQLADHLFVLAAWLVVCLVLFVSLGAAPLTDLDEGAFSEATREMMVRGDFISPWLLDTPRFDKPVLIHWLQMAAFSVTGFTSYGARLPSALMGLVWVGGIAGWAYMIAGRVMPQARVQVYGWAVLISGTCLGIPAMARAATADATLNAFLVLTLLFIWRGLWPLKESESGRLWIRVAAVFVGLGLLTKGPIAVLVPAAASLIGASLSGTAQLKRWLCLAFDPVAWGLVLILATPWYVLQFQAQGMAFVNGFLGLHNLGRFTSTMHGFSAGPLYYPTWMLIASLPWTVPLLVTVAATFTRTELGPLLRRPELRMCWAVLIFVLVFFSFSATKLPHYGFYGLSGLIVLISLVTVSLMGHSRQSEKPGLRAHGVSWVRGFTLVIPFLTLIAFVGFLTVPQGLESLAQGTNDPYYQTVLSEAAARLQAKELLLAAIACGAMAAVVAGFRHFRIGLATLTALLALTVYGLTVPTVMHALRDPIVQIGELVKGRPERVVTWRLTAPSLSFAANRVIPASVPAKGDLVVLPTHLVTELPLKDDKKPVLIFQRGGLSLVGVQ